jgi:uncharacterized protein (DUF1330 family)
MPKAYIVANNRPRPDFTAPPAYADNFKKVLADHGGKIIISTRDLLKREGEPKYARLIVVEFSDRAKAEAAYEQYARDCLPLLRGPDRELFIVEGT